MKAHFAGSLLLALLLAACTVPATTAASAPPPAEAPANGPPGPPPPTEAEKADCAKRGGEMQRVGMLGSFACVIPYPDAGKTCADDADCGGACWISGVPAGPNKTARGQCQPTNMPFGCHASLDKGVVSPEMCAD